MDKQEDNSKREKFSGLVLPWLEHLYKLFLDPFIKKHNLILDDEFWILLSFSVFSGILYLTGINVWVPISFFFGSMIILLLHNSSYIRRKIFPKESEKMDEFLNNLKSKQLDDILIFIKSYQLDTKQIIQIIEHKKKNYDVYLFIRKYQLIKSELIEYLIQNKLYDVIEADLFCQYLTYSIDHISKEKYELLRKSTENKQIIKTLNLCYPFYLKNHAIFKFFSNTIIKIRNAMTYGGVKITIFLLSLLLMSFAVNRDPSMLQIKRVASKADLLNQMMGNIFAFFMTAGFITLIVLFIIKYIVRLFRFIVYLFAPSE